MRFTRYHKYTPSLWDDLNLEDLVGELSDFLLQSGFGQEQGEGDENDQQSLHDAILDALLRRGLLSDEDLQRLLEDQDALDQFLQKTVERMVREGYLRAQEGQSFEDPTEGRGAGLGPPAALGLLSFQMLRYQFWGFGLFVFALYAKNLVQGGGSKADTLALLLSGLGGLVGGALGLVLAQKWKDRIPPIRLLLASMTLLGAGTLLFGGLVSVAGFAGMLFVGFFSFFLGKISADTITQQAMPDDFRGRAFALFDIAYNLGFIVPALILSFIWVENSAPRTRVILMVSGAVFLVLTALVAWWARSIRDQFAPQDDLVEIVE